MSDNDADDKWIAGSVKRPGALHEKLGVPQGKKIPVAKIEAAAHSSSPLLREEAQFALNVGHHAHHHPAQPHAHHPPQHQRPHAHHPPPRP